MVKIYFAKRKLIWEIMEDGLKNKIEIEWADILALRVYSQDDETEVLEVEVGHFFHIYFSLLLELRFSQHSC